MLHVGALLTRTQSWQIAVDGDGRQRSVQTGIAVKPHRRTPRKLEQLLRGTGVERQRAGPDEEIAKRCEPGGAARRARVGYRLDRLREAVG